MARYVRPDHPNQPPRGIAAQFGVIADPKLEYRPRYNLCPSEQFLAMVLDDGSRRLRAFRWGFASPNAGFNPKAPKPINARSETVATRPMFRDAFQRRRCLVVADGFYEWKVETAGKVPHVIRLRSHAPFEIAGLWEGGTEHEPAPPTALVLTCAPNDLVRPIHDRLPVVLRGEAAARWLDPTVDMARLHSLLVPLPADLMESFAVSTAVNNPRNDGPDCLGPRIPPTAADIQPMLPFGHATSRNLPNRER